MPLERIQCVGGPDGDFWHEVHVDWPIPGRMGLPDDNGILRWYDVRDGVAHYSEDQEGETKGDIMPPFDWRDVLKRTRKIIKGRGDNSPCAFGRFCPRCCGAIAKGQLDDEHGSGLTGLSVLANLYNDVPSDKPLNEARIRIAKVEPADKSKNLTREEALKIVDRALETGLAPDKLTS